MQKVNKSLVTLLAIIMMFYFIPVFTPPVLAADAAGLVDYINGHSTGLIAEVELGNPGVVNVNNSGGDATITGTLNLVIASGVTVKWQADLTCTLNAYLFNISGGGEFEISNCTISNDGAKTGGAINITGAATVTVGSDANVIAENTGNPVLVASNGVEINVEGGGTVRSSRTNSNAAIQIGSGSGSVMDTKINVTGGAVISDLGGYAINDGAGTGIVSNNTIITISSGMVTAGSACAIRSTGASSEVTVSGGVVSNAAGNNANPTIYMNGGLITNVTISGGIVESMSNPGFVIQTTGNVSVSGGIVTAIDGRAINLVGMNSKATISDGIVQTTGTGASSIAISTATTAPDTVANTSVVVTGGTISSVNGNAIQVTGAFSEVLVSGGIVSSVNGNAIQAGISSTYPAVNAKVFVSGGSVTATGGVSNRYAIRAYGSNSNVFISDRDNGAGGVGGRGGQVSVFRTGAAIYSNGTVTVNGGFVFAFGTNVSTAINASTYNPPTPGVGGIVGVWNQAASTGSYAQNEAPDWNTNHLEHETGIRTNLKWYFNPILESGIDYRNGLTSGFFPLLLVTVTNDYGIIFDSDTGQMFKDFDGSGTLQKYGGSSGNNERFYTGTDFFHPENSAWSGSQGELILNGFSWATTKKISLTIIGDTEIVLNGDSEFESTYYEGTGIKLTSIAPSPSPTLTLEGSGTLTAKGSDEDGIGLDIGDGTLKIGGGALIAQGEKMAISWDAAGQGSELESGPEGAYYRWQWSKSYDGAGGKKGPSDEPPFGDWDYGFGTYDHLSDPFKYYKTDKYVMLQTLEPIKLLSAVQVGGASGVATSIGIVLTFSAPVTGLTYENIDISGDATKGVTLTGSGDTWTVMLGEVSNEGTVDVTVDHFGAFYVVLADNEISGVEVYKASEKLFELTIIASPEAGGVTAPEGIGAYLDGTRVEVTAAAKSGYRFTGWAWAWTDEPGTAVLELLDEEGEPVNEKTLNLALFDMPDGDITLMANFTADSRSGGAGGAGNSTSAGKERDTQSLFITKHYAYIVGYPDGNVSPERKITRAEISTIFFRLLTDEARDINWTTQNAFPDVDAGSWYNNAISVMSKMGTINGYPDGTFRPNGAVTRAEIAAMAARFARQMQMIPINDLRFSDVAGHWAKEDIEYAAEIGWVNGYLDGTYKPGQNMTRAEFMTLINRMLERVPETSGDLLPDEMIRWADNADPGAWYYLTVQEATNSHVHEYKDESVPGLRFNYEYWIEMMENNDQT